MNLLKISENLIEFKYKLRKKFPELSENDMSVSNGNVKRMLSMVAYKLRKSPEELESIIEKL